MSDGAATRRSGAPARPTPARPTIVYRMVWAMVTAFCRTWFRLRVEGLEHLPREGGVLLAANHQSYADIPLIAAAVPRHVTFVARDTLAEWKWLDYIMRQCGAILLRRGASDRAALRAMAEHLANGDLVAIYPEGTRTRDGRLGVLKGGAVMAARLGGVRIVPVGIRGAYQAWPRGRILPWPRKIGVRFGPLVDPTAEDAQKRLEEAIRSLMGDGAYDSVPPIP